ncbi:MAG: 2,5-furandicarboxylate decarboxylase 1 [Actinomycetota bacterium]|jgi:4-hydroxy-3-polyprenylbenzoate decarboxylase
MSAQRRNTLPRAYDAVDIHEDATPRSVDCDIPRMLAAQEARTGHRPTMLFTNIAEYPDRAVLGNPYPRAVMLAALGVTEHDWLTETSRRLTEPPTTRSQAVDGGPWREVAGSLGTLPIIKHRPGDAGRYITAAVGVTRSAASGTTNLGVYRVQLIGPDRGLIFFDPRTDAHANWLEATTSGRDLPIALFLGGDPTHMLVAASRLPNTGNDYDHAARLARRDILITGDPPAPLDAHYVIRGRVTAELATEGPFAEFKGYYVPARQSPTLIVDSVEAIDDAIYPTIVTGAESGVTLMALQNEYLMFEHLTGAGFHVGAVRYWPEARGEFVATIDCTDDLIEVTAAALDFDKRAKIIVAGPDICGHGLRDLWDRVASHGFQVVCAPYFRKGSLDGQRLGIALCHTPIGERVEY